MSDRPSQADWLHAVHGLHQHGSEYHGPCPACGGEDRFRVLADGAAFCRQCDASIADLRHAAGLNGSKPARLSSAPRGEPTATWTLRDHDGDVVAIHKRFDPQDGSPKVVAWYRSDGSKGLGGRTLKSLPLYGIHREPESSGVPVIVEGEKAADALQAALGTQYLVLGTVTGAAATPGATSLAPVAAHATDHRVQSPVFLWPDNDDEGRKHMARVAKLLTAAGAQVRIINWEAAPPKGDAADWTAAGQRPSMLDLRKAAQAPKSGDATPDEPGRQWAVLVDPRIDPMSECFATAVKHLGVELRHNTRSGRDEIRGGPELAPSSDTTPDGWTELTRAVRRRLFVAIESTVGRSYKGAPPCPWSISSDSTRQDLISYFVRDRQVDPFREYLLALPSWDFEKRLDPLLVDLFGKSPDPEQDDRIPQLAARLLLGTAVVRAFHPATPQPVTPVIVATIQGQGKSSLARCLLPVGFRRWWFGDGLNLAMSRKEVAEVTAGKVIVELPDMTGARRAELSNLKSWQTTLDDGQHRAAYGESAESKLRMWSGVGTVDKADALPYDPAGHRRWLAVSIGGDTVMDTDEVLNPVREQLWAEALHFYRDTPPMVPRELWEHVAEQNRRYEASDPVMDDLVAELTPATWPGGGTITDLMKSVGVELRDLSRSQRTFAGALRRARWRDSRERSGGRQRRVWFPPKV